MFSDADHRLFDWAARHDGVFSYEHALAAGLSRDQADYRAANLWHVLYRGVYVSPGTPLTDRGRLRATCLAGSPHAAVSHRAAATYYDVPGARRNLLEVTCPRWMRTTQRGLVVHETTRIVPEDIVLVDDLPVYRPERVALQLAGIYRNPDFVETVLQAMRRKRLITYESTLRMFQVHAGRGVRGSRAMRMALERWDPTHRATESEMETLLLQVLRSHGITDVVPQHEVFDAAGRFIARVDVAVMRWKAAVEYDSKQEHSDEFQIARDNSRRNRLRAAGWHPVVARHGDLLSGGAEVVAAIRACAAQPA